MTLQKKILVHLFLVFFIFSMMLLFYIVIEQLRLKELRQDEKIDHQEILTKLITLKGEALYTLSYDYTYWDEMVNFVQTLDETWSKENLEASLDTYKTNLILIYNLRGEPIYKINNLEIDDNVFLSAMPQDIPSLFSTSPFCHFYVSTQEGFLEIRGTSIHKTDDQDRQKERFGYFFAGRLWNKDFLDELALLAGADLNVVVGGQKISHTPSLSKIVLTRNLPGWNNLPAAELHAVFTSPSIINSIRKSKQILVLFTFFFVIESVMVISFLVRRVSSPLRQISLALEKEDSIFIEKLQIDKTEFGKLAQLIKQFFAQKDVLLKEIAERKKAEYDLKEAQFQLLQSEKMASIGQLAAGVAHEINNPVGYIASNIESLQEYLTIYDGIIPFIPELKAALEAGNTNRVAVIIQKIEAQSKNIDLDFLRSDINSLFIESKKGVERIKTIISDLRTFARADDKEKKLSRIEDIIESVLGIVQNEIKYKADLVKEYSDTPMIFCHPQQLGQVFINLLVNASHAIEKHGVITIKTYTENGFICAAFSDTGAGIPKENIHKIFDPFFTTKPVGKGTGLGLSISFEIINKIGGKISVVSEVGKGTTFTVLIPKDLKEENGNS